MFRKKEVVEVIDSLDRYLPESFLEKELYSEEGLNFLRDSIVRILELIRPLSKQDKTNFIHVLRLLGEESVVSILSYLYMKGDSTFSSYDDNYFNRTRVGELSWDKESRRALLSRYDGVSDKERRLIQKVFRMLAERFDRKPEECLRYLRVFQATPSGFCYFVIMKG